MVARGYYVVTTFKKLIETRSQLNPPLKSNDDIDIIVLKRTTDIQECTHLATTPSSSHSKNYPLPNHTKHLIQEKRKAKSFCPSNISYKKKKRKKRVALQSNRPISCGLDVLSGEAMIN